MKLTGVALSQFTIQHGTIDHLPESCQNALIIEFFDSIRYEGKPLFEFCFSFWWHNKLKHQSFNDVCVQSITKANEIFNLNNQK